MGVRLPRLLGNLLPLLAMDILEQHLDHQPAQLHIICVHAPPRPG